MKLAASAAKLSQKKLGALMHISDALAKLNVERFRTFPDQPERPAIYAFAGDVYAGFEVHSLDDLKENLVSVVIAVLAVLFLREAVAWEGGRDLLPFGGALALVIAA